MDARIPQNIFIGQIPEFALKNGTDWLKEPQKEMLQLTAEKQFSSKNSAAKQCCSKCCKIIFSALDNSELLTQFTKKRFEKLR